jgi:homoserine kinase type II
MKAVPPSPSHPDEAELLTQASQRWAIEFVRQRNDLRLAGSPERTVWRTVVESRDNHLFVLEKIPSRHYGRKRRIISQLTALNRRGTPEVIAYLPAADGDFIPVISHGLWQLSPYAGGVVLNRPAYAMEGWRGDAAASFLTRLKDASAEQPDLFDGPPFTIGDYISGLFATLSKHAPETANRFLPFLTHLETHFFPVHDNLPTAFCHGDFHPLNMIWSNTAIRAVIDWEFCGIKPEAYDLATLLGCLGMEDPSSLAGPLAHGLISTLKRSGMFSDESWRTLPDLMLAIRFAWLSEWMRKSDWPMIRMEADYMTLLLEHRSDLTAAVAGA